MIEVNNLTTSLIEEDFLKKICQEVLKGEKKEDRDLSIALVGQGRMRNANKKYRGKNRITDVLAFPESRALFEKFKVGPVQKTQQLGEVLICYREVKKNAKRHNTTSTKELARILIHGVLHLLGYDHEKDEVEAEEMRKKEEFYLNYGKN